MLGEKDVARLGRMGIFQTISHLTDFIQGGFFCTQEWIENVVSRGGDSWQSGLYKSMYVKREGLIQIQTQSCGKGSFSTGKKRGEDSFRALFITAVIGSDEADQPGLTATVNMLRNAGLKLQYELFRQNMRKDFLAARKIRHCSKASRYGFDPRWLIRANSTPWLLIPISMMFITRYHSIRPGRMGFQNISQPCTQEGLHSSTRSARGVDVTPFTAHPLVLEFRL